MSKNLVLLSMLIDEGDEEMRPEALLELERRLARGIIPYELYLTLKEYLEGDEDESVR